MGDSSAMSYQLKYIDFDPSVIPEAVRTFNSVLKQATVNFPKWWTIEDGAAKLRRGELTHELGSANILFEESAISTEIPSRDPGRGIPCRVLKPRNRTSPPTGIHMYLHGGGWVLGSEAVHDVMLQRQADAHGMIIVSVGYRLAPEDPYPAGHEDCFDVAEWLICNAEKDYNTKLAFIGGESAGALLAMSTALHLIGHPEPIFSDFKLNGLIFYSSVFSFAFTPSLYACEQRDSQLPLLESMEAFRTAYLGKNRTEADFRNPDISPMYADLQLLRGKLPSALFLIGSEDPLIDDTLFMSARWVASGGEAQTEVLNGLPHGFICFDIPKEGDFSVYNKAVEIENGFFKARLAASCN